MIEAGSYWRDKETGDSVFIVAGRCSDYDMRLTPMVVFHLDGDSKLWYRRESFFIKEFEEVA